MPQRTLAGLAGIGLWEMLTARRKWPQINDYTRIVRLRLGEDTCRMLYDDTTGWHEDRPGYPGYPFSQVEDIRLSWNLDEFGVELGYGPLSNTLAVRYAT